MKKRRFKHLSWTDRLKIETMLKDKRHKQEIADEIGVHLKTIYNEIKRGRYIHTNSDLTEEERYSPEMAEAAYREHLAAKGPDLKIGNDHELAQHIEKKIAEDGYSPAAVFLSKAKRNARITKSRGRSGRRLEPVSKTARKKSTIARSLVTGKWTVSKARRKQRKPFWF